MPIDCGIELIRVGGAHDGGYLIPDDLSGVSHCFSPGVSTIATFEKHLIERYGILSFLADYSVDSMPGELQLGDFEKKFISSQYGESFITLQSWMDNKLTGSEGDLILQMDIEGAEYDSIVSTSHSYLNKFRIIVIELHWLDEMVFDTFNIFGSIFRKLTENHKVVHLHPNNCCGVFTFNGIEIPRVMEVTLLRHDRLRGCEPRTDFPHTLDAKNVLEKPDILLPRVWFE